jgi:transketolase
MRYRFTQATAQLLDENEDVVVVMADIGVGLFAETGVMRRHPDRVVNVGIREQAMIGVAAGYALEGFRPIVHSYTPFLIERPFEQLKLDLTHQGLSAVLVSIGGTYDSAREGRTHQSTGDVASIATLPNWQIHVPGHPDEMEMTLRAAITDKGSTYIRLAAASNRKPHVSRPGEIAVVRHGSSRAPAILAMGPMLEPVLEATQNLDTKVGYTTTPHPIDIAGLHRLAAHSQELILVEPYAAGTSTARVTDALSDTPHRLLSIGAPATEIRRYGTRPELEAAVGLDAAGIAVQIQKFLGGRRAA